MKKLLITLVTLVMMATMIGCSGDVANESDESNEADKANESVVVKMGEEFKVGEKEIVVKSVEKFVQYNEEENYENYEETQGPETQEPESQEPESQGVETQEGIAVNLEWTNNSDESMSFSNSLFIIPFQDGIELDPIYMNDEEFNESKNIRPGITLDIKKAYLPRSTSPLEIEIIEYDGEGDKIASFIIEAEFPE